MSTVEQKGNKSAVAVEIVILTILFTHATHKVQQERKNTKVHDQNGVFNTIFIPTPPYQ